MVPQSWTAALFAVVQLSSTCHAQSDVPSVANYRRRVFARHPASLIGDYVYFDGGEVSQVIGGKSPASQYRPSNPINTTLSIDLSKSWKPEEVEIKQTQKSAPKMMRQAIFTDNSSNAFYIWGGFSPYGASPPRAQLWKFNTDGSGGGSWSTEIKPGNDAFTGLTRSQGGTFVSTPDSGFYFGGYAEAGSDPNPNGPVPGFLQFNYTATDQAWTNHTDVPYSNYRTLVGGSAHYVPTYGPNGLIMILGGGEHVIGSGQGVDNVGYLSFGSIWFMDPVTKEWYSQRTSGNAPGPRMWHCTVGLQGPNNTYEIFVFGGSNIANSETYDEVHILSLPGFVWKKANYTSRYPRDCQSCVVAGQRQMISFGGIDRMGGKGNSVTFFNSEDPLPQGLGVFDLTTLEWKDEYDAAAASYETPEIVKSWYDDGNLANVEYSSDVAALFKQSNTGSSETEPGSGSSSDDSGSSSTNTGAIAGGVVGGVAGAALIGLAIWLLRRRKQKKVPGAGEAGPVEAPSNTQQYQVYSPVPPSTTLAPSELQGEYRDHSVTDKPKTMQPHEMDAQQPGHFYAAELDGTEARK
ncbi:Kelch repeat-containing protein-like protein 6 [Colletotrichum chlorophyti]|uniref:Kelch repeat-containing protein-like protein 6 n=1 Tax=Colletotrichum chlorophyti TaxID=708187 RepID=A0A1Q8RH93_9PEZI|nr:Kelch repeat-containing protein-like protein 6 [Colletotrichum chlorophyti]